MPENDLALLVSAARAAGEIASEHFGRSPEAWDKPGGEGPVSSVDLAIDRMLRDRLGAARPGYGWLSEESADDLGRLSTQRVFIVDPIDGTRAFLRGDPGFAHAIAVAEAGRVTTAVVHLPELGRTYAAAEGEGATLDDRPIRVSARGEIEGARVLANRGQLDASHWPHGLPRLDRHVRPSLAHRICLAAAGEFDAAFTFRDAWEWDVAAGGLIAREAGAIVTTRERRAPVFNNPVPKLPGVIVAGPVLHAEILARI